MKFYLVLFLLSCQVLQAQEFVPFNRGYISSDSIVKMQIRSETVSIFFWTDTIFANEKTCLLYTSDAADERSSVDLGGRRIIKKKKIIDEVVTKKKKKKKYNKRRQ